MGWNPLGIRYLTDKMNHSQNSTVRRKFPSDSWILTTWKFCMFRMNLICQNFQRVTKFLAQMLSKFSKDRAIYNSFCHFWWISIFINNFNLFVRLFHILDNKPLISSSLSKASCFYSSSQPTLTTISSNIIYCQQEKKFVSF